jgi:hypothetical protein
VDFSREYSSDRRTFPAAARMRPYLLGLLRALRRPLAGELESLVPALVHAAGQSSEARSALRSIIADEAHPARQAVLDSLQRGDDPAAARVLLALLSSGSRLLRERAASVLRNRREPAFLLALARAASWKLESGGGISAAALAEIEQAPWESLSSEDVSSLPARAQRRLMAILRRRGRSQGDRGAGTAGRLGVERPATAPTGPSGVEPGRGLAGQTPRFWEHDFPAARPYRPMGTAKAP